MDNYCIYCGRPLTGRQTKYCSDDCMRSAAYWRWYTPERAEKDKRMAAIAKYVHVAYGYKCAICGWGVNIPMGIDGRKVKGGGCEIHHLIPVKEGGTNDYDNLILLCPNCHKLATYGVLQPEDIRKYQVPVENSIDAAETGRAKTFAMQYIISERRRMMEKGIDISDKREGEEI